MTSPSLEERLVFPPEDLNEVHSLASFFESHDSSAALVSPDGTRVALPHEVYEILRGVVEAMGENKAITLAPHSLQLTTQEAADFLGISRPTLVKLLNSNEIPFERPTSSRHRRLRLLDVMAYQNRRRNERQSRLDEMTRQAVEDGLYETDAAQYRDALRSIRGKALS